MTLLGFFPFPFLFLSLMKTLSTYVLVAALAALTVSCKKDSETPAKTKTDLLTGKDWIITAATVSPGFPNPNGGAPITDFYAQLDACDKDDFVRFDKPNTFKSDEGANRCTGAPQTQTGTWSFNSNETILSSVVGTDANNYNVLELAESNMKLGLTEDLFGNGVNYTLTFTFAKK